MRVVYTVLQALAGPCHLPDLISDFTFSIPAALSPLLFLEHTKPSPTSGPLHMPSPHAWNDLPIVHRACFLASSCSLFKCPLTRDTAQISHSKIPPPPFRLHHSLSLSYFILHHYLYPLSENYLLTYFWSSMLPECKLHQCEALCFEEGGG